MQQDVKATDATLAYRGLRRDILTGALAPGQKLAVDMVAERYGIGTNPTREALNRLSSERLVDRHDQRGFFVPEISLEAWRELVKTRCWIEAKALEESIAHRTKAWEERIVLALHHLSRSPWTQQDLDMDRRADTEQLHRDFHMALLANCGSSWLLQFCEVMMDQAQRYIFISAGAAGPRRHGEAEHAEIAKAAIDGQSAEAQALLIAHYQRTLAFIEQAMAR